MRALLLFVCGMFRHTTILVLGYYFEVESDFFGQFATVWPQHIVWWSIGIFYLLLAKYS